MTGEFKGGNSRQLAKILDAAEDPLAILDRRGQITFVNAALCQAAATEAMQLVGKPCRWDLTDDGEPQGGLLNILAPPTAAREGQLVVRRLSRSPLSKVTHDAAGLPAVSISADAASSLGTGGLTGQLFFPLLDEDRVVHLTLVLFSDWEKLSEQHAALLGKSTAQQESQEQLLAEIRSRWARLDSLVPLLGESPAIQLAMKRAQLAGQLPCNVFISGPQGIGKREIAQGIFQRRAQQAKGQANSGQWFPIDVSVLDDASLNNMLDVFVGRLRSSHPVGIQQLVLERLDKMSGSGLAKLLHVVEQHGHTCSLVGLSESKADELSQRGPAWRSLLARVAEVEINIPPLRQRREDILMLAQQYLAAYCRTTDRALLRFSPKAINLMLGYSWPRNLHQLKAAVESSVEQAVLTTTIDEPHLPVEIRTFSSSTQSAGSASPDPIKLDELLEEFERAVIQRAVALSPRNRAQVARWLGISRPRLLRRIDQLGLNDMAHEEQAGENGSRD